MRRTRKGERRKRKREIIRKGKKTGGNTPHEKKKSQKQSKDPIKSSSLKPPPPHKPSTLAPPYPPPAFMKKKKKRKKGGTRNLRKVLPLTLYIYKAKKCVRDTEKVPTPAFQVLKSPPPPNPLSFLYGKNSHLYSQLGSQFLLDPIAVS